MKSAYWLSYTPTEKFNLIELAHTQRAISNFVKILTKKDVPVEFFENNQYYLILRELYILFHKLL